MQTLGFTLCQQARKANRQAQGKSGKKNEKSEEEWGRGGGATKIYKYLRPTKIPNVWRNVLFYNSIPFQPLPLPSGADLNNDDSGLRPSKQPPIAIGGTLTYQCPGVKSVTPIKKNIYSWLSRLGTAKGLDARFSPVGCTKDKACKAFKFT